MSIKIGIDVCVEDGFRIFNNKRLGLLVHSASFNSNLIHTKELFIKHCNIVALFAPEHGLYGEIQYMKEVNNGIDEKTRLPIYSLYGKKLQPTKEIIKNIDTMVIDLQDIGSRYYTYIWTMTLVIQICAEYKKEVIVLDRPNPINGIQVEGPVNEYSSFVGLYPIPVRHGMTIGELAIMFNKEFNICADVKVIKMDGWQRNIWFDDTKLQWIPPSPNIPTLNTAIVYPGMCLLEGTNISEGRGTTKPFEYFGAPFIDNYKLCDELNKGNGVDLSSHIFRPIHFIPSTDKWKNEICRGAHLHIIDRNKFKPFITGIHIIKTIKMLYPDKFQWRLPPYEYEKEKLPFDILVGNSIIRKMIEDNKSLSDIEKSYTEELNKFSELRKKYLLYE